MTPAMFWDTFWSTLLADLIVGGVIVVIIQLILSYNEKRQIEFEERKKNNLKAIGYMKSILGEVELNTVLATDYLSTDDFSKDLSLSSTLWNSFMATGELPTILGEDIFVNLSFYYSNIEKVQKVNSLLFHTRLFKNNYLEENLKE